MATPAQLKAARENGKKGGRPKGLASIEADKMREYIAARVAEKGEAIVSVLLKKGLKGDISAIRELFDRGFGRAPQSMDVTSKGEGVTNKISFDEKQFDQLVAAAASGKVVRAGR